MISRVRRVSKSMNNLKKWNPECFGTQKNPPGWAGLAGMARWVAVGRENRGQKALKNEMRDSNSATTPRVWATGKTHPNVWGEPLPDLKIWCWGARGPFFHYFFNICLTLIFILILIDFGGRFGMFLEWKFDMFSYVFHVSFRGQFGVVFCIDFEFELQAHFFENSGFP